MLRAPIAFCLLTTLASAQFFTIGRADTDIRLINGSTALTLNTIPTVGSSGFGFNGMAQDPLNDQVYVIDDCGGSRDLGLIDLTTGAYSLVGSTGLPLNSLAFDRCGNLFALEGKVAGGWGNVYSLDKITGAASFLVNLPLAGFGSAMMYEDGIGMLVVYADCPTSNGFLVDPDTLAVTALTVFPMTSGEIRGGAPQGGAQWTTDSGNDLYVISTLFGQSLLIGSLDHTARGIVYFEDTTNSPGTGDPDFCSVYGINGGPQTTVGPATDVVTLLPGDSMFMGHASFGGTFVNVGELVSVGSLLPGGAKMPFLFPGIHINIPTAFLMSPPISGIPPLLPPTGFFYSFIYGGGALVGIDMVLQGFVIEGFLSINGIFASTDGLRVELR